MAHYALLNADNVVVLVHVGKDETDLTHNWEQYYSTDTLTARRTSYNTIGGVHLLGGVPFRKNFAGIGYTYDAERDAFIPPQPYPSWTLDDDACLWQPPTPYPDDGNLYTWDEDTLTWVEVEQ
jgi:hypothetical protein